MFFSGCVFTLVQIAKLSPTVAEKAVEAHAAGVPWATIIATIFTFMAQIVLGNVSGVIAALQALIDAIVKPVTPPAPAPTPAK